MLGRNPPRYLPTNPANGIANPRWDIILLAKLNYYILLAIVFTVRYIYTFVGIIYIR